MKITQGTVFAISASKLIFITSICILHTCIYYWSHIMPTNSTYSNPQWPHPQTLSGHTHNHRMCVRQKQKRYAGAPEEQVWILNPTINFILTKLSYKITVSKNNNTTNYISMLNFVQR